MSWAIIFSGLALGAISSFHCVGMCGPIAFALPVQLLPQQQRVIGIILYNLGRITTYSLLGLIVGLFGRQIFIAGYQQVFSIIAGVMVLVILVGNVLQRKIIRIGFIERSKVRLQKIVAAQLKRKSLLSMYTIGLANGFLPCGLVYLALTAAMAAGSLQNGIVFMSAYGAGTLPAMFAISYFGAFINLTTRNAIKKMLPYGIAIVGILLILRGMNLNIPYVSPFFDNSSAKVIECH